MEDYRKSWNGRNDGDGILNQRLFQNVSFDNSVKPNDFVIIGFAVDEGVKRNKGRIGAKDAPNIIRKNMSNFPVVHPDFTLKDFGNVTCEDGNLELAQRNLASLVTKILDRGTKSVVLGGGHEVTYAHYSGIKNAFPAKKVGIINIDAHFDNREVSPEVGASSGTGFWQIGKESQLNSLHIGIQRNSNTLKLFDTAHKLGMKYILAEEIFFENLPSIYQRINDFIEKVDVVYLTICMDVFNASIAPGVSAMSYNGIFADNIFSLMFRHILKSEKLIAMDVAEVNPTYDRDEMTVKLAACLVNDWFMYHHRK